MRQVFVFTAGDKQARSHLDDSIKNLVPVRYLDENLSPSDASNLKSMLQDQEGFYAWGAVKGERNIPLWESMSVGDFVLTVYDNRYRYISSVIGKVHSIDLAKSIWGLDSSGNTWEYVYFLSEPGAIDVPVLEPLLEGDLNKGYRGFTRISEERTAHIRNSYGNLDSFFESMFSFKRPPNTAERELEKAESKEEFEPSFDPTNINDGRMKIFAQLVCRRGQPKFRRILLDAYGYRCAVTGCDVEAVLEAAHIIPYSGEATNHVTNGILLRADLHTLFDLGAMKIDADGTIQISDELMQTEYGELHGKKAQFPKDKMKAPHVGALSMKFSGLV